LLDFLCGLYYGARIHEHQVNEYLIKLHANIPFSENGNQEKSCPSPSPTLNFFFHRCLPLVPNPRKIP